MGLYFSERHYLLKGTVSVILSDIPFKEGHHQFTTVPFKPLAEHQGKRTPCVCLLTVCKNHNIGVYASMLCDLNADDVTFIHGKSRIFFVQCGFQKFECEYDASRK